MKRGTYSIVSTIFKSLQEMSQSCSDCVYKKFNETWKIFEEFMLWIGAEKQESHFNQRPIGTKLAPIILDALRTILKPSIAKEYPSILNSKLVQSMCILLKKVYKHISKRLAIGV
jgi:hypothetical protein